MATAVDVPVTLQTVFDPALPAAAAAVLVQRFVKADRTCLLRLLEIAKMSDASTLRLLDCVELIPRSLEVQQVLGDLLLCSSSHARSKAALLFGRKFPDKPWFEQWTKWILDNPDARVRANAVESLWQLQHNATQDLLFRAAKDVHHRVIANAALGLFYLQDDRAGEIVHTLVWHQEAAFRAAGAFAIGESRQVKFLPDLRKLLGDPADKVRTAAIRAIMKMHRSRCWA